VADRVTFTPGSADRIAKVVRIVEAGNRDAIGYVASPRLQGGGGSSVRMAYYTATSTWQQVAFDGQTTTANTKTIQFAFPTSTPFFTAVAVNHFVLLTVQSTVSTLAKRQISVMKEAGMWRLIAAEC